MATLDLEAARLWFECVDTNGSGYLESKELRQALELGGLNYSLAQVHQFVRAFDHEGDQKLDVNEFIELHRFLSTVHDCFAAEARGGQVLQAADVPRALARLGHQLEPQALQAVLRRFDPTGRGALLIEEFLPLAFFMLSAARVFSRFDSARSGRVTLDFKQFCYASAHLT